MSTLIESMGRIRTEVTKRIWGTTSKKNAPPTYVSDFVLDQAWNRDSIEDQAKMVRMSAPAWSIAVGLANNVFDDGFRFVSKEDPEKEVMKDILRELERMEHLKYLSLALAGERTFGKTYLAVFPEDVDLRVGVPKHLPARVANLDVFTPEWYEIVEWSEIGEPLKIEIKVLTSAGKQSNISSREPVDTKDCILFRTRPFDRSDDGLPSTYPIWNALVSLELIFYAITSYSMKHGFGALIMTTKGRASTADINAAKRTMEDLSVTKVGVIPNTAVEKLEFIGAAGSSIDFSQYIDAYLGQIAAGSKYPKDVLLGINQGGAGSAVIDKALYALVQGEQTKMEPYIRDLVRRMGHEGEDYDVAWNVRYATDEMQLAQIRELNARADITEVQAERLKNMPEDQNPDDVNFNVRVKEGEEREPEKDQNPSGRQ